MVFELKSTDIEGKLRLDKLPGDLNKKDSLLKNVTHFFNYLLRGGGARRKKLARSMTKTS